MEEVHKSYRIYFKFLNDLSLIWDTFSIEAENPIRALSNQAEQLQIVLAAQLDNSIWGKFPDIKKRLECKIRFGLEDEMILLMKIIERMRQQVSELKSRHDAILKAYENCDEIIESTGSPLHPTMSEMLEFAQDSWRYYHSLYPFVVRFQWITILVMQCVIFLEPEVAILVLCSSLLLIYYVHKNPWFKHPPIIVQ